MVFKLPKFYWYENIQLFDSQHRLLPGERREFLNGQGSISKSSISRMVMCHDFASALMKSYPNLKGRGVFAAANARSKLESGIFLIH